jgi:hypothetical protein
MTIIRVYLNESEVYCLEQLMEKVAIINSLSNFHKERIAYHTLAIKIDKWKKKFEVKK